jgi:CheY-like chemotaxis protein
LGYLLLFVDGVEAVRRFREEEQRVLNITSASARRKRISQLRNPFIYGPSTSRHRLLVVGMSANCGVDSKTLAKEAGMDFFLGKPFTPSIFMRLMNRVAFGYRSPETSTGSLPPVKV